MLKLFLLLAAVAALAVAAPSAAADFNDLDASPLDASPLDASPLDASPLDASDLNNDSDLDTSDLDTSDLDTSDLDTSDLDSDLDTSELDSSDLDALDHDDLDTDLDSGLTRKKRSKEEKNQQRQKKLNGFCQQHSNLRCKGNQYIGSRTRKILGIRRKNKAKNTKYSCNNCPDGKIVPYGDFKPCGNDMCFSCPFTIDPETNLCVISSQDNILKGRESVDDDGVTDMSALNEEEQSIARQSTFLGPSYEVKNGMAFTQPSDEVKNGMAFTRSDRASPRSDPEIPGVPEGKDTKFVVNTLQTTTCATGLTCCLPGFYGPDSSSCTECPSDKPSSPYSAPNSQCACPNSAVNKCFACTNKCKPYSSQSRMCLPYQCPSGQTCKVQSGAATCV